MARQRVLERDDQLAPEGDGPAFVGVVLEGYLRKEKVLHDGRRTLLGVSGPGDLVMRMPGCSQLFSIEAATPARICLIDERSTSRLLARESAFRRLLTTVLIRECEQSRDIIWRRGAQKSHERVVSVLLLASEFETRPAGAEGGPILRPRLSRQDWAALADTSIETISRTLSRLARERILETVGANRYRIRDAARLKALAGFDEARPFPREQAPPAIERTTPSRPASERRRSAGPVPRAPGHALSAREVLGTS